MSTATLVVLAALAIVPNASAEIGYGIPFGKAAAAQQFESSKGWYFSSTVTCAGTEAAVADQPLQVFASNYTQFAVSGQCGGPLPVPKNTQAGDLAVKWVLEHAAPNTTNFSNCRDRAWKYNSSATSYMDATAQFSGLPCGGGLYRTKSVAKWRDGNNVWHQGSRTTQAILK